MNVEPSASELSNTQGFIGHATHTNAHPANFIGSVDEFRIWTGALNKEQVQSSYLLGPDAANPLNAGALQSISMKVNDPVMIEGTIQRPVVQGTFAAAGVMDLTRIPGLSFSSDHPNVVAVDGDLLKAGATGSVQITVTYSGQTRTGTVTVTNRQLMLTHRYTFNSDAKDSIGHADGLLRGNARIETNSLVLDGSLAPQTFVQLPSDLIGSYDLLTIEAFLTPGNSGNQGRLYDFGNSVNVANQDIGWEYLFMSPIGGNGSQPRVAIWPDPGVPGTEQGITVNQNFRNARVHIVTVVDSLANTITLYTNGVLASTITNSLINLAGLSDIKSYIGRSVWPDPNLTGSIDEFRIYYGAMSASEVAASYAAGTGDGAPKLNVRRVGNNVVISWAVVPGVEAYELQFTTSLSPADWQGAGTVVQNGGNYEFTLPITGTEMYFRLTK